MARVITASTLAVVILFPAVKADALEGAICPSRKVAAAGKKAEGRLKCHDVAATRGIAVVPLCLAKTETRFTEKFSRADANPPCFVTGDAAAVEAVIDAFVDGLVTNLRPSPTASRCAGKKLKASGKKTRRLLICHQRAILRDTKVDPNCLTGESVKFDERVADAEELSDCLTTGDAAATEAAIDAFLDVMVAALRPVTPSKCTSEKLQAAGRKGRLKLLCHRDGANDGVAVVPSCLVDAEEDFDDNFADAEEAADCYTTGDAAAVEAFVDDLVDTVATQLRPALTASKCAAIKLTRSGQAYEKLLRCRASSVSNGLPLNPGCVTDANELITGAFASADDDPGCLTTGDAAAVLATVTAGVSSVEGALLP